MVAVSGRTVATRKAAINLLRRRCKRLVRQVERARFQKVSLLPRLASPAEQPDQALKRQRVLLRGRCGIAIHNLILKPYPERLAAGDLARRQRQMLEAPQFRTLRRQV